MTLTELKAYINQYISTKSGDDKITGEIHNAVLHEVIESVLEISGTGFGGDLAPADDPGDQVNPIWFLASEIGTFTYCSGLEVTALPAFIVFKEDAWSITQIGVPTDDDESTSTGLKGIARADDPEPEGATEGDWYVFISSEELDWTGEDTIDSPGIVILDSVEPSNSWVLIPFGDESSSADIDIDETPTDNSTNAVSSGGTYTAIATKANKPETSNTKKLWYTGEDGHPVETEFTYDQVLQTDTIDTSSDDWDDEETRLLAVRKDTTTGDGVLEGAIEQLDKFATDIIGGYLADSADWEGDNLTLLGENYRGELGESGQEYVDDEGQYFMCKTYYNGTDGGGDGYAVWVRNRSRDCLDDTNDADIIAGLVDETDWDTTNNTKIITNRSKIGSWYTGVSGYTYFCRDTYTWRRIGQPETLSLYINDSDLITEIEAHDFDTTPILLPTSNVTGEDLQEHYWDDDTTPNLARCVENDDVIKWIKIK